MHLVKSFKCSSFYPATLCSFNLKRRNWGLDEILPTIGELNGWRHWDFVWQLGSVSWRIHKLPISNCQTSVYTAKIRCIVCWLNYICCRKFLRDEMMEVHSRTAVKTINKMYFFPWVTFWLPEPLFCHKNYVNLLRRSFLAKSSWGLAFHCWGKWLMRQKVSWD